MYVPGVNPDDITSHETVKMEGYLEGCPLLFLIDNGARHNFINAELVTFSGFSVTETQEFEVSMAVVFFLGRFNNKNI